jgi:fibronectin-binding autotransporter adhesin
MARSNSKQPTAQSSKRGRFAAIALRMALLSTVALPTSTLAQQLVWSNPGEGDWQDPANWVGGVVPSAPNSIKISNGGTAVIDGTPADAGNIEIASEINSRGSLSIVKGGSLSIPSFLPPPSLIGTASGSVGALTVDGMGSQWTGGAITVGGAGQGTVTVSNSGSMDTDYMSVAPGGSGQGTVNITTGGSFTANFADFGRGTGEATLNVTSGGTASFTNWLALGFDANSSGTANVTGAGSTLSVGAVGLHVGAGVSSFGVLTVSDGGTVRADGGTGTVGLGTGDNASGLLIIGGFPGSLVAPGSVEAAEITLSPTSRIFFNHTSNSYAFTPQITGAGGVTIAGGTTALTGANSYTGGTEIGPGTVQISADSALGAASGSVTFNGGTLETFGTFSSSRTITLGADGGFINPVNGTLTLTGAMSGSGQLTKIGAGTLTLTGDASNLTGDVEVGAGTLAIASGGQFASANGVIESDGSDPSGVATVRVSGAGSVWSTSFIGVGRNNEAALVIEHGGRVQSDLSVVASDNYGSLGTVTVTGANSQWNAGAFLSIGHYGHGTVLVAERGRVEGDIVVIGGGNASASGDVTVSGAGSELVGRISSPSFDDSSIVVGYYGTSTLTVTDGGRVAAPNGSILLASQASAFGTLNIGAASGEPARAAGVIDTPSITFGAGNGTIVFNHTGNPNGSDLVFSPTVSGSGSILHENGNTTLTGDSSGFSGTTAVSGGRLSVNGTLGGTMQVRNGGTLSGSGTIGAGAGSLVTVASGGKIAPGNLIGTLNVAGSVTFAPGSVYQLEVNAAGQSDRIAATGSAAITGGTVQVLAETGSYRPSTIYTIITAAGGRTGTFSGVTSNFAFLTPTLGYDVNAVTLTLSRKVEPQPPAPPTPDNPTPPAPTPVAFHSVAVTPNQYTTADGVEALGSGNPLFDVVLGQSVAGARQAFDALSGEAHASATTVAYGDSRLVRDAILRRLRQPLGSSLPTFAQGNYAAAYTADRPGAAPQPVAVPGAPSRVYSLWGEGFGSWGRIGHNGNAAGLDTSTGGFILGADAQVSDAFRIGLAGGFTRTTWDVDGRLSSGSTDSIYAALYGSGSWGGLNLRLGGFYAGHDFDVSRTVTFPGFSDRTHASYDGWTAQAFGELGYQVSLKGGVTLEPFLGASVMRLHMDGFQEEGGAAALTSYGRSYDLGTTTLGLRAEARLGLDLPLTVRGMVGWRHAYGDVNPSALLAFSSGASAFNVAGIPIDRDALVAEAGLDWQVNKTMTLGVSYTGQIGERAQAHAVKGNFSWRFETW